MARLRPKAPTLADALDVSALPSSGGHRVAQFLERYVVTPMGEGARTPFRLRPWQRELVDIDFEGLKRKVEASRDYLFQAAKWPRDKIDFRD